MNCIPHTTLYLQFLFCLCIFIYSICAVAPSFIVLPVRLSYIQMSEEDIERCFKVF